MNRAISHRLTRILRYELPSRGLVADNAGFVPRDVICSQLNHWDPGVVHRAAVNSIGSNGPRFEVRADERHGWLIRVRHPVGHSLRSRSPRRSRWHSPRRSRRHSPGQSRSPRRSRRHSPGQADEQRSAVTVDASIDAGTTSVVTPAAVTSALVTIVDQRTCVMCQVNDAVCATLPCGHRTLSYCTECSVHPYLQLSCPVCHATNFWAALVGMTN